MVRNCGNCARYHVTTVNTLGECRAHPPTVHLLAVPVITRAIADGNGNQGASLKVSFPAAFPEMPPDGWCGEFTPKFSGGPATR
jgi:hypothetical protein